MCFYMQSNPRKTNVDNAMSSPSETSKPEVDTASLVGAGGGDEGITTSTLPSSYPPQAPPTSSTSTSSFFFPFSFSPSPLSTTTTSTTIITPGTSTSSTVAAGEGAGAPAIMPLPIEMIVPPLNSQSTSARLSLDSHMSFIEACVPYLDLRSIQALCATSKTLRETIYICGNPQSISVHKPTQPLDASPSSSCFKAFQRWGGQLQSLSLHRTPMIDKQALPTLLLLCGNMRRLSIHDCDLQHWADEAMGHAILSLSRLEELRLHCSDLSNYETSPFAPVVRNISKLSILKKLTLFTRLDSSCTEALSKFLSNPQSSKRLIKLKLSTTVIASPGGTDIITALNRHPQLQKLTLMRPEGMGEPLRKLHCTLLANTMVSCKSLYSVHLRRAGMWTDTLQALVPTQVCPNIRNLKLDSNSLAYLSATYFNEAIDSLLSRLPLLEALHLGNNQLDSAQAIALASSLSKHKIQKLQNLTLGSNDIGDAGLAAILKSLPAGMRQLYLHGCDIHDDGLVALKDALERMPSLWGLGLNGNPIGDVGVKTLAKSLRARPALRDVGITLSDMTDDGVRRLAASLQTCPSLRFVYLYTQGFKAATKVTEEGKTALRQMLPEYATPAFDHRLSRYLKQP